MNRWVKRDHIRFFGMLLEPASCGAESYESGKPLTLARALALTLEHSPELSAFSWDIRSAEARIIQAKLIPNPEI
jgi:hypothetical protein